MRAWTAMSCVLACLFVALGCASKGKSGAYDPMSEGARDTQKAARLNEQALPLVESTDRAGLGRAEDLLREALGADLYYGPAHNNLGVVYLSQGKLYEAAGEFEWARKLMPGHPDPRVNLALTLESAGRSEEAMETYRTALEVYPDHIGAVQGLARLSIKAGKPDEKTPGFLREIAMRGETPEWREWAKGELTRVR